MKKNTFLFIVILITISACQKIFEKPRWQTDIVAPLLKTSLSVENIFTDTSMFKKDGDTVKLIIREKLYDVTLDTIASIDVEPYEKTVKLSTLKLAEQSIVRPITLLEIATAMGGATGEFIKNNNGSTMPFIPPFSNLTAGPLDVDINQFFETAVIKTGTMDIKIENKLPVNIQNVRFELKNKNNPGVIANPTFANILKNTSQTQSFDLAGKEIDGDLAVVVQDMDLAGGVNVVINHNDALIITVTVRDITVESATAVFPAQDVVSEKSETELLDLDALLTLAKLDEGIVVAEAYSTSQDTVYFTYKIPSLTKGLDTFEMKTVIPPSLPGQTVYKKFSANFNGYNLDLTGQLKNKTNTFYSELTARIEYTGRKVSLSLDDSIQVEVRIEKAKPYYIKGYLGSDNIEIGSGSFNFDVFKRIESGLLNFEKVKLSFLIENGLGLDASYKINNVTATNTKTGVSAALSATPINGSIVRAVDNGTGSTASMNTLIINSNDARALLNVLPDKINYNVNLTYNPGGNNGLYNDFAYNTSNLVPYMDLEVPLSVQADQLVLSDTVDFISDNFKTSVKSGTFTVHVDNGFPLAADLKMYFLNAGGAVVDSVISSGSILSGILNTQNRVTDKTPSKISFYLDENRMANVMSAKQVIFKVRFNTTGATTGNFVRIFTDYSMDFKLSGDFAYTIE